MGRTYARGLVILHVSFTEPWTFLYGEPPLMTAIFTEPWSS